MKKALIFDIDGTLWDSTEGLLEAWNGALIAYGLEEITAREVQDVLGLTDQQIKEKLLGKYPQDIQDGVFRLCIEREHKLLNEKGGRLYPNEVEVLKQLAEDYELMILTNAGGAYVNLYKRFCTVPELFTDSLSNGENGKNKAENIKILVERNGIEKACYIGDTLWDQEYSQMAGVDFIWTRYGFGHDLECEYVVDSFAEIPEAVRKVFS